MHACLYAYKHIHTYLHSLCAQHKLVIAREDKVGGKFPLLGFFPILEVGLELLSVLLILVPEGMQHLDRLAHLVDRLLHLAFEQLVRSQEVAGLGGTLYSEVSRV